MKTVSRSSLQIISYLLKLRYKMGLRMFQELGWWRSVLVGGMMVILGFPLVAGLHFQRKDAFFIQTLGISKQHLFASEYVVAALPMIIILTVSGIWMGAVGLFIACFILAWIPVRPKARRNARAALRFPVSLPYEWASGLRSQKWTLVLLIFFGLICSWFNLFAGWIFIFFITATVAVFYQYCEPVSFILLSGEVPTAFMVQKMIKGVGCYLLLTAVLWIEIMLLYPENMVYSLLFFLGNVVLMFMVIIGKYAFYHERLNIKMMISILFGFGSMCLAVPFMPPVLLLLMIWLWVRATKRLGREVYAFH